LPEKGVQMNENTSAGSSNKSCWNCSYQQIGGDTFLGKCTWFSKKNNKPDKEIPPDVVDVGCKQFVKRR